MSGSRQRFRYWRDPTCRAAVSAYLAVRWLIPSTIHSGFWRGHAADLLLVPAGLPLWLWLERRQGWRRHDGMPRWGEVVFATVVWTVAAEVLAPRIFASATADPWDAVSYACGALLASLSWREPVPTVPESSPPSSTGIPA